MTDFDLDRLGEMWRQDPDPVEIEKLRRTAELVARRARHAQIADAVLAIVVSAVVLVLALSNPKPLTLVVGAAAIALILFSSIRQRRLRGLELKSLTGSTEEMLDQSIERVRTTLKRKRLALIGAIPGLAVGLWFGAVLQSGPGSQLFMRFKALAWGPAVLAAILIVAFAVVSFGYYRSKQRDKDELQKFLVLRNAFSKENENTDP